MRPGGVLGVPNGCAKHLVAAAEDSCRALGRGSESTSTSFTPPDPRVPLGTSVRALADLKRQWSRRAYWTLQRHRESDRRGEADRRIDSIQVEASLWHDQQFLSGVVCDCVDNRLRLLAYGRRRQEVTLARRRPILRGPRLRRSAVRRRSTLHWHGSPDCPGTSSLFLERPRSRRPDRIPRDPNS